MKKLLYLGALVIAFLSNQLMGSATTVATFQSAAKSFKPNNPSNSNTIMNLGNGTELTLKDAAKHGTAKAFCLAIDNAGLAADESPYFEYLNTLDADLPTIVHAVCTGQGLADNRPSYWTTSNWVDTSLAAKTKNLNTDKKAVLAAVRTEPFYRNDKCDQLGRNSWTGTRNSYTFDPGDPESGELIPALGCIACKTRLESTKDPKICNKLCGAGKCKVKK